MESLINRDQKLDSKKFFRQNSKFWVIGLHLINKKKFKFKENFCGPCIKESKVTFSLKMFKCEIKVDKSC
jgi:hypothetical protein